MSVQIDKEFLSKELDSVENSLLENQNAFVELCINNSTRLLDAFTKEKVLKDSVTNIKQKLDSVHTKLNNENEGAFVRLETRIRNYQQVSEDISYLEKLKDTLENLQKMEQNLNLFDNYIKAKDYKNVMKTLYVLDECSMKLPEKIAPQEMEVLSPSSKRLKKKKAEQTEYPPILDLLASRYAECKHQVTSALEALWKEHSAQDPTQSTTPYHDFQQALEKFKVKLVELGLLDNSTFPQQVYQLFANELETRFMKSLCQAYLVEARDIMKNKDYATIQLYDIHFSTYLKDFDFSLLPPEEVKESNTLNKKTIYERMSEESNKEFTKYILGTYDVEASEFLYVFPRCLINITTKNLFGLIHTILRQATQSPLKCAEPLVNTTRQIFELYLLLVPKYHESNIADIPQIGMTFYNDCQFLAYQIQSLYPLYKSQLPSDLKEKVFWLDFVPLFRREAEQCLANLLKRQHEFLLESLNFSEGLHDTQHSERYDLVQKSMNQINHKLSQFAKVAKDVLPVKLYKNLVGELLDGILLKIIQQVLKLHDISEDECNKLHTLLQIVQKSKTLFTLAPTATSTTPTPTKPLNEKELELEIIQYAPAWTKYKKFCELLILKLVEIENKFDSAYYAEFQPNEIQRMVEALFSDTPNRKRVLDKVAANK